MFQNIESPPIAIPGSRAIFEHMMTSVKHALPFPVIVLPEDIEFD